MITANIQCRGSIFDRENKNSRAYFKYVCILNKNTHRIVKILRIIPNLNCFKGQVPVLTCWIYQSKYFNLSRDMVMALFFMWQTLHATHLIYTGWFKTAFLIKPYYVISEVYTVLTNRAFRFSSNVSISLVFSRSIFSKSLANQYQVKLNSVNSARHSWIHHQWGILKW